MYDTRRVVIVSPRCIVAVAVHTVAADRLHNSPPPPPRLYLPWTISEMRPPTPHKGKRARAGVIRMGSVRLITHFLKNTVSSLLVPLKAPQLPASKKS